MVSQRPLGEINGLASLEMNLRGALDIESADEFREAFTDALERGVVQFFVDLGEVDYVDSTGLGSLMQLYREAKGRGGIARFYDLTPPVREIFSLTRLDKVIPVDQTREAAFAEAEGGG